MYTSEPHECTSITGLVHRVRRPLNCNVMLTFLRRTSWAIYSMHFKETQTGTELARCLHCSSVYTQKLNALAECLLTKSHSRLQLANTEVGSKRAWSFKGATHSLESSAVHLCRTLVSVLYQFLYNTFNGPSRTQRAIHVKYCTLTY